MLYFWHFVSTHLYLYYSLQNSASFLLFSFFSFWAISMKELANRRRTSLSWASKSSGWPAQLTIRKADFPVVPLARQHPSSTSLSVAVFEIAKSFAISRKDCLKLSWYELSREYRTNNANQMKMVATNRSQTTIDKLIERKLKYSLIVVNRNSLISSKSYFRGESEVMLCYRNECPSTTCHLLFRPSSSYSDDK